MYFPIDTTSILKNNNLFFVNIFTWGLFFNNSMIHQFMYVCSLITYTGKNVLQVRTKKVSKVFYHFVHCGDHTHQIQVTPVMEFIYNNNYHRFDGGHFDYEL